MMDTTEIALEGHNLVRTFADGAQVRTVLDNVSLTLRQSELVLLMGPSGSGKSTLVSVLSGLLSPTSGRVLLKGEDLWAGGERRREDIRRRHLGFIFQGYNLFPALTARQQLEITLRWGGGVGAREARRRSERMLGLLGLGAKMNLRPAELSGGEKQRVAIGRALVKSPALCFADEPTSALDWANGESVVALLRAAAHEEGAAVLVVSHDPRIAPLADRVLHLEAGCLTEESTVSEPPLVTAS
jgi:putative ABC transport system ATP-binding protein